MDSDTILSGLTYLLVSLYNRKLELKSTKKSELQFYSDLVEVMRTKDASGSAGNRLNKYCKVV